MPVISVFKCRSRCSSRDPSVQVLAISAFTPVISVFKW